MPFVPDAPAAAPTGGRFVPDAPAEAKPDYMAEVAAETPEWERRAAAVGRSMSKPFEALRQLGENVTGGGAVANEQARKNALAMEALYRESPAARKTGIATDVATGFLLPGAAAGKGAGALDRILAGATTGGLYSGLEPVTTGKDFASEKAKQVATGVGLGGGLSGLIASLARVPGLGKVIIDRFRGTGTGEPTREPGEGAEKVSAALQAARDKIEGKVKGKLTKAEQEAADVVRKAEEGGAAKIREAEATGQGAMQTAAQKLEAARAAARGGETTTGTEFGALSRDIMAGRKAELEAIRDSEAMPLLDAALNSGAKVNVSGIPKQIDLMLKNEKNPDIERALLKAKSMLYAKDAKEAQQFAKFDLKTAEGRAGLQDALAAAEGKKRLDTSVRGLDSARLAIKSMMTGRGSEPADKFAQAQLSKVLDMLEDGLTKGSPEYGSYLSKYRELSKPLDVYSSAVGGGKRAAAAVQKDKFEGDFLASPESMGARFFKSGDEGTAAAREFKAASGDSKVAQQSMTAYIAGKLKDTPPEKWDAFLRKHESALKEYGVYDSLRAFERSAVGAEGELSQAGAAFKKEMQRVEDEAKRAVKEAQASAKETVMAAQATEKRVSGVLKDSAIGKLTTDAASYRQLTGREAQAEIEKILSGASIDRDLKQAVSAIRGNPEAQSALRQSYMDWIAKTNAVGEIDTAKMLTNWRDTKGAIEKSGLFDPSHVQAMDKIMGELKQSYTGNEFKRSVGNAVGWILGGGYKGAYIGRQMGGAMAKGVQKDLENMVLQMALDPQMAARLASAPTAENVAQIKRWIDTNAAADIEKSLSAVAGRESAEQRPKKRAGELTQMPRFGMVQ
jgi:hypothetical protein